MLRTYDPELPLDELHGRQTFVMAPGYGYPDLNVYAKPIRADLYAMCVHYCGTFSRFKCAEDLRDSLVDATTTSDFEVSVEVVEREYRNHVFDVEVCVSGPQVTAATPFREVFFASEDQPFAVEMAGRAIWDAMA